MLEHKCALISCIHQIVQISMQPSTQSLKSTSDFNIEKHHIGDQSDVKLNNRQFNLILDFSPRGDTCSMAQIKLIGLFLLVEIEFVL